MRSVRGSTLSSCSVPFTVSVMSCVIRWFFVVYCVRDLHRLAPCPAVALRLGERQCGIVVGDAVTSLCDVASYVGVHLPHTVVVAVEIRLLADGSTGLGSHTGARAASTGDTARPR